MGFELMSHKQFWNISFQIQQKDATFNVHSYNRADLIILSGLFALQELFEHPFGKR